MDDYSDLLKKFYELSYNGISLLVELKHAVAKEESIAGKQFFLDTLLEVENRWLKSIEYIKDKDKVGYAGNILYSTDVTCLAVYSLKDKNEKLLNDLVADFKVSTGIIKDNKIFIEKLEKLSETVNESVYLYIADNYKDISISLKTSKEYLDLVILHPNMPDLIGKTKLANKELVLIKDFSVFYFAYMTLIITALGKEKHIRFEDIDNKVGDLYKTYREYKKGLPVLLFE